MKKFFFLMIFLFCLTRLESEVLADSFMSGILRFTGITATPKQLKGVDEYNMKAGGDLWEVKLSPKKILSRITTDGGYRTPLFLPGDKGILALKGNNVVRISIADGTTETLYAIRDVEKLVGFDKNDQDKVLVLIENEDSNPSLGLLSIKSGEMTSMTYDGKSKEHRSIINHIKGWERNYNNIAVYPKTETKPGMAGSIEWTDVYMKQGDKEPINLSRCNGINCGQPSLSHDGNRVVFVKATGLQ